MNNLPVLPFELVLSNLSLEDHLKSRAVSRIWRNKINTFRVKSFCYSNCSSWFTKAKSEHAAGLSAQNFICAPQFDKFVNTFHPTILSRLTNLRLCCFQLDDENRKTLPETLKRFDQLEELTLFSFTYSGEPRHKPSLTLDLPTIKRVHFKYLLGIKELTLNAPKLKRIKIKEHFWFRLHLVHAESVEHLTTNYLENVEVQQLKNLRYLFISRQLEEGSRSLLAALKQLKEIHLNDREIVPDLFEQKRLQKRADLKIFLCGIRIDSPKDPNRFNCSTKFNFLVRNHSKLATEMPFHEYIYYKDFEDVSDEILIDVLKRFTGLEAILIDQSIKNIPLFFECLKHVDTFVELIFFCDQPQELFDQLPEHCASLRMIIDCAPNDFRFLFRLKKLVSLQIRSIDLETACGVLKELDLLSQFKFTYNNSEIEIRIDKPNKLQVLTCGECKDFSDPDSAIEFVRTVAVPLETN